MSHCVRVWSARPSQTADSPVQARYQYECVIHLIIHCNVNTNRKHHRTKLSSTSNTLRGPRLIRTPPATAGDSIEVTGIGECVGVDKVLRGMGCKCRPERAVRATGVVAAVDEADTPVTRKQTGFTTALGLRGVAHMSAGTVTTTVSVARADRPTPAEVFGSNCSSVFVVTVTETIFDGECALVTFAVAAVSR